MGVTWVNGLCFDPARALSLDLLLPSEPPRAVILYLHGGGFRKGARRGTETAALAQVVEGKGLALAAADYRLNTGIDAFSPEDQRISASIQRRAAARGAGVAKALCGPAFAAAIFDASAAIRALRAGRVTPLTAGLPIVILGLSAGGIAGLALAHPPAEWASRLQLPDAVMAISAAVVMPWRLSAGGPPCHMFNSATDWIIPIANPRRAAALAQATGTSLTLTESHTRGHNPQWPTFLTGKAPDGRRYLELLEDMIRQIGHAKPSPFKNRP